ncbi:hypothetical protein [Enterococcus faecalis]
MQTYYSLHGPNRVPVDAFSLWTLRRDYLDPEHEGHKIQTALQDSIEPEVAEPSAPLPEPLYAVPEGTACKAGGNDDVLSSDEQKEFNEQAAQSEGQKALQLRVLWNPRGPFESYVPHV